MKIKRYKKAERYMSLYKNNFGFREPYQILLDGTFCQVALDHKVNIHEQLPRYLSGQCKLLTTACVIEETKRLGKPLHGSYVILSQFPIHNCNHEKPISASKCLSSFIIDTKNNDHYLVATQDHQLRLKIAKSAICPLIKLANNSLVIDKPPEKVLNKVGRTHHFLANRISDEERTRIQMLKEEQKLVTPDDNKDIPRKKRGKKGPNPLSCKKKKNVNLSKKNGSEPTENVEKSLKRRKRKKARIPRHVRNLLNQSEKLMSVVDGDVTKGN